LTRDLSLVIPRTQTFAPIIDAITSIDHITDIHTFDLYAGDQLPDTHKSIALQLTIHHPDNQLTTDQINTIMDSAISAAANHGAILRKDFTT
jgi:phenylalanyl-tRNA synthetase beta chain